MAAQRRIAPARLEGARRGSGRPELDDGTVRLVEQAARGSALVDDAHDAVGARLEAGIGAVVRVEGVDVVGAQQRIARDLERDRLLGGFGRGGRRGRRRLGCRRSGGIGRPGHGPGASGEQQD